MNLIKTAKQSNVELTERFKSELETPTPMFEDLVESKKKEMVFVSQLCSYRNRYTQRSAERKFYDAVLDEVGITADKRQDYTDAYAFYLKLINQGAEFACMAEQATPYQLLELKRCEEKKPRARYDAARFFNSKGRMPSVKLLRDYKNNQVNSSYNAVHQISSTSHTEFEFRDVPEVASQKESIINALIPTSSADEVKDLDLRPAKDPTPSVYNKTINDYTEPELAKALLVKWRTPGNDMVSDFYDDVLKEIGFEVNGRRQRGFRARFYEKA